ncbi:hypothetical protein X801_00247 [Opisthorchis viverrini]|uniref:Cyclic nucleotide-binding domain-containing protein n=1 Tax=Opisthorchis viverrini TaxID=6198 RepID=A0A1S8XAV5_OPIVI|nr:hypothetical protein X801_00247 [Opisthorchis viverrini]
MAPPPKSRFAVRALTYADVQFIDRHDLTDLCHVYPELAHRLLERFELTIPLVSPNLNLPQPLRCLRCEAFEHKGVVGRRRICSTISLTD